ncbi:hypothetical protein [Metabacillus litoralis]|uniref:hypothetical protein n=1 Tax=Metabacillus litoralis TaxID=152268 RepID=UPI00203ED440|nr:hypothetical protein [Metabacillus litoralis]
MRIGTNKSREEGSMSRYHENRDKQEQERRECVQIPRESGQIRAKKKRVYLDTARIGTNKSRKEESVSRYYENQDK